MSQKFALIIEDDPKLAKIFSLALTSGDFATELINDGRTALKQLKHLIPDVIVLDLHLPYVSGQEILWQIKQDDRLANTHVIIATADALLAEELESQADIVLLKPISVSQLKELAMRLAQV